MPPKTRSDVASQEQEPTEVPVTVTGNISAETMLQALAAQQEAQNQALMQFMQQQTQALQAHATPGVLVPDWAHVGLSVLRSRYDQASRVLLPCSSPSEMPFLSHDHCVEPIVMRVWLKHSEGMIFDCEVGRTNAWLRSLY